MRMTRAPLRVAVNQRGLFASGGQPKYGKTTDFTDDTDTNVFIRVIREIRGSLLLIPRLETYPTP